MATPTSRPRDPPDEQSRSACLQDVSLWLDRYVDGVEGFLRPVGEEVAQAARARALEAAATESRELAAASGRLRTADGRLRDAHEQYCSAMVAEKHNLTNCEAEVAEVHAEIRTQELRAVEEQLDSLHVEQLEADLEERCNVHMAAFPADADNAEDKIDDTERDWANEACENVVMEMRQDWRSGQRQVLQQLARDLRSERSAIAEALERQAQACERVARAVQGTWAVELQRAQEELDQVTKAYTAALQLAMEMKLRETRLHAQEQADFFQREVREAMALESRRRDDRAAQLRRMRIASLKRRQDYTCEARRAAEVGTARMRAAEAAERAAITPERAADVERLRDCRVVLGELWARLPGEDDEVRDFLLRLEESVPYSEEALAFYEAHLAERGIFAALDAGRGAAGAGATAVATTGTKSAHASFTGTFGGGHGGQRSKVPLSKR